MRVLILGAGNAQIDAIKYCKNKKWIVYGCSYTNMDKGIPLLDYFKQIDIKDVDAISEFVRKENIEIVYSVGSDLAMPTVMKVSEKLNLPHFISPKTADICQNKSEMRETLGKDFIGNLPYMVASSFEEAMKFRDFPAMMKPTDSQGQRGCYRVDSKEDIQNYFEKSLEYSNEGKVIIEKFVSGPEVSVNAYCVDGKIVFALISDRIVFQEFPGGIIKEHILPSGFAGPTVQEKIFDVCKRAVEKLNIVDGPVYFQIKIENDEPYILEVTPRLDGCHMWNLIKHYCGVDLLDITFQHLVHNIKPCEQNIVENSPMKLSFMCEKTGEKFDRSKYDTAEAEYFHWYYETGDIVRKLNGFMEKGGYQIKKC